MQFAKDNAGRVARAEANFALRPLVCLLLGVFLLLPAQVVAQTTFPQAGGQSAGTLFGTQESLFPDDGRIKVLMMAFNPFGLTESAAEQIGLILQKDLANSGHFAVVGPREMNALFETDHPELVDCREIACGVDAGKRLGAEQVLVGSLRIVEQVFILRVRLIDTLNNTTHYDDEIRFRDETMDEDLFRLSNTISSNSPLTGRVLSTSIRGIVISLGKRQGLKLGDFLVVYKQEVPINDLDGELIDTQKKNIAIVKVLNVNQNSSEAILAHKTEEPEVSHFVQTFLDRVRQIELVENTRRELDTGIRLENRIRPLELAPVLLADSEKKRWRNRLIEKDAQEGLWFIASLGGVLGTAVLLNNFSASGTSNAQAATTIGLTVYSLLQLVETRQEVNQLRVEGRAKGYLSQLEIVPQIEPGRIGVAVALRF